ncbi:MAG: DUF92 domain-containing protein [Thermoanaerobaculia bacterium]
MSVGATEAKRKAVHVGMAAFALLLRWLDWRGAALCALAALAFNLVALPRLGGRALFREDDRARGYPVGILLYPLVVLVLVLLFRHRLDLAAAGWGFLAFGDGFATLVGVSLGGPRLPWNRGKSWSGFAGYVAFGSLGAAALASFVAGRLPAPAEVVAFLLAGLAGAAVESLPSELDDNLVPPLAAAGVLSALLAALPNAGALLAPAALRQLLLGLAVNVALPAVAALLRVVRPSGALAGGLVGTLVLGLGGWSAYALLWAFFAGGTLTTRFRRKRKEAMGKAEEAGGRRGAANVLANCSVATFLVACAALTPASAPLLQLAAAAAFATALMDTVGTEVGQALKTPTVLLPDFRRVPPGTDGAVSVGGTVAGLLAALLLALLGAALGLYAPSGIAVVVVAAFAGTVVESLLGRDGAPWRVTNGHVLNFFNTLAGAALALLLA